MTSAEAPAASPSGPARLPHVALLVVVLLAALALSERDSGFTVDEGSYAIQSEAVADGAWAIDWPFRAVDPDGRHFPYHAGRVTAEAEYAYVSHPAWPAALSLARRAGPETVALRLVPMASVLAGALTAWGLARRLSGPEAAPWAFWIAATSPLLPNGLMLWAHAPATALAGLSLLGAVAAAERGAHRAWWAAFPAGLAGLVLLRSEGLLFAVAAVGVVAGAGLLRRDRRLLALGAVGGTAAAAALAVDRLWAGAIAGDGGRGLTSRADAAGWLTGRLEGAATVLVDAGREEAAALCSLAALALVLIAVVRRRQGGGSVALLLAGAAALTVLRAVVGVDDPVHGLLVAWPAVALALLVRGREVARGPFAALCVGAALFAAAVVATQYDDGGGLQWGGRYLAPLVVPLAAAAGVGAVRQLRTRAERGALVGLLAATAVVGLVVTDEVRQGNADAMRDVAALGPGAVLVDGSHLARLDWRGWPERCWLSDDGGLAEAVARLEEAGALPAAYVGFEPQELAGAGIEADPAARAGIGVVRGPAGAEGRCPR